MKGWVGADLVQSEVEFWIGNVALTAKLLLLLRYLIIHTVNVLWPSKNENPGGGFAPSPPI